MALEIWYLEIISMSEGLRDGSNTKKIRILNTGFGVGIGKIVSETKLPGLDLQKRLAKVLKQILEELRYVNKKNVEIGGLRNAGNLAKKL